ncbi:aldose 1-epimerase [Arthrobacter stackebrandtii]|uniref:Aldose 1-epimerase n=1 Tax=Arthrobacter stackebrandtii TaxID=272161 RepID=A0ABS4YS84_9MICC|nr:aldose 1-epimerase family protein [Arthrobacter stackebrandtii]MBP2411647.1 aldose 1-epimerase [Arthrobacter stackebrandtii]PYG99703.1 aldose epimerase [Arthrobacter stackebrandtii]
MVIHESAAGHAAATGQQFTLEHGGATATVTALAAGLRSYTRGGAALVESYPEDQIAPGASGITLAPFANRVDGGLWQLDGAPQQLDITEVPLNNAIHGLLRNTAYHVLGHDGQHVLLEAAIHPQHGYPFLLRHQVRYELDGDGHLRVAQTLHNDSAAAAPFVLGAHPYFTLGGTAPEELHIQLNADTFLKADERMIPTGSSPVAGRFDLRTARPVPESLMDTAFTGLVTDDGVGWHTLSAPDGRSVSLWHDGSVEYVHVYITDKFPGRTLAVAMEPMTGPANAFNSGEGLRWLAPGESFTMNWGIESSL